MANVIWRPQPKQAAFMARPEFEALYGGAAGGGKSDALVIEALRQVHIPHYKGLILRKTFPQLSELIDKSQKYYTRAFPGAKYSETSHTWKFPSGAKIRFGSMQYTKDRLNYQGQAYDYIAFDELTHFTADEYMYMISRCRPNGEGTKCYIRATANPGGIGHAWVKDRFITAGSPMQTIWEEIEYVDDKGKKHTSKRSRVFIPSTVFDNPELLKNDPGYVENLASLPEAERNALLYGNWDTFSGQVFTEWRNDPSHYEDRTFTHVINPFVIPQDWSVWCSMDWGYSKPFSIGWYAVDRDRRLYRIREFYGCTGAPDVGLKMEPSEVARKVKEIEESDPNLKGRQIHRVGDPAIWGTQGAESIGTLFERERIYFEKGNHDRIDGKMQIHHRLAFDENGIPLLYVFKTCKHFIRTVPALVYSESNVEDVDTNTEDHIYDECLVGETKVCTKDGMKPIEDLVGTSGKVLSHDGKWHEYHSVRKTKENVKVFTIEMEDGTKITATENHPFLLSDGTWKRLNELKESDPLWQMTEAGQVKIKSITEAGTADTFNMEVDETHDYAIENGVISHNCRYVAMKNPIAPQPKVTPKKKEYDPLSTDEITYDPYGWYRKY